LIAAVERGGQAPAKQGKPVEEAAAVEAIPFVAEEKEMAPEEIALAALETT